MSYHRLWNMRCYLAGAMDKEKNGGKEWRARISPYLQRLGLIVLNPCNKPIEMDKQIEDRKYRTDLKNNNKYDILSSKFELIREVDLKFSGFADFLIVNIDMDVPTCGTYEEIVCANNLRKPILIKCVQGKKYISDWIFGMMPHEYIFDSFNEIIIFLNHISNDKLDKIPERWTFFDYSTFFPQYPKEESQILFQNLPNLDGN